MQNSNIKSKLQLYALFSFGLLLLFIPLYYSFKGSSEMTEVIRTMQEEQLTLYKMSENLKQDLQISQVDILQAIILDNPETINEMNSSFVKLERFVKNFESFLLTKNIKLTAIDRRLGIIAMRMVSYKLVRESIVKAIETHNKEDIEDGLLGFTSVTRKFLEDLKELHTLTLNLLSDNMEHLKKTNEQKRLYVILSFITSLVLVGIAFYKLLVLYKRVETQLNRAETAETKQRELQNQLLKYNDNLESEIVKITQELHKKIYFHFITSLPNRNKLLEDLAQNAYAYMALLNIDKFQQINDVYGEEEGNTILRLSADFLKNKLENTHMLIYHIGSDEFVIISSKNTQSSDETFVFFIKELLESYKNHIFLTEMNKINLAISAGISFSGDQKMLAYADMALKDAKKRNLMLSIFDHDKELEKKHQVNIELHKTLLNAFETNNILSYFQPIIPLQNNKLPIKYESLVRLRDGEGSILAPNSFMDIAIRNKLYARLTKTVIHNTLNVIKKHKLPCSINISMEDINNIQTVQLLYETLEVFEYSHLVTIELLETETFSDYQSVLTFCKRLRSLNVSIALDDFGSGYSNFSHIMNLPIDYIKIDASLISSIDKDINSRIMVETIVALARRMKIDTIAEYVASKAIYDVVVELGITYAQGFYLGRPKPIEEHLESCFVIEKL